MDWDGHYSEFLGTMYNTEVENIIGDWDSSDKFSWSKQGVRQVFEGIENQWGTKEALGLGSWSFLHLCYYAFWKINWGKIHKTKFTVLTIL